MKKILVLALCVLIVLSFCACSSKAVNDSINGFAEGGVSLQNAADNSYSYFADEEMKDVVADTSLNGSAEAPAEKAESNEKIIKTVDVSVETKEFDTYISSLNASVNALGGYVENSTADFGNGYSSRRFATYTVRIPADKLESFIVSAGENGTITSKTENQQNVTLEYVDLESRIEAYKTEKQTLTNLLEKAESLDNVLAIQERLSEVNYQIESYTSQLKVLENRVSYSTVTLRINEVERVTEAEPSLWTRIKNEFADNLDELVEWFKDTVVSVIGGLPILIPLFAVVLAVILIIRRLIKKRRAKKNKQ